MSENSSIYFGGFLIDNNTFYSEDDGIYIEYYEFCYSNYDTSITEIGNISVTNNTLHVDGEAIYIYYDDILRFRKHSHK